jgi:hypothetical protein
VCFECSSIRELFVDVVSAAIVIAPNDLEHQAARFGSRLLDVTVHLPLNGLQVAPGHLDMAG